jgi:hypothetical protein
MALTAFARPASCWHICCRPDVGSATGLDLLPTSLEAFVPITSEPLAIMGIGCRLHGDIETPDALWNALIHARDSAGT